MHESFPEKSASTLSVRGSSGLLSRLSGSGEKSDYPWVVLGPSFKLKGAMQHVLDQVLRLLPAGLLRANSLRLVAESKLSLLHNKSEMPDLIKLDLFKEG